MFGQSYVQVFRYCPQNLRHSFVDYRTHLDLSILNCVWKLLQLAKRSTIYIIDSAHLYLNNILCLRATYINWQWDESHFHQCIWFLTYIDESRMRDRICQRCIIIIEYFSSGCWVLEKHLNPRVEISPSPTNTRDWLFFSNTYKQIHVIWRMHSDTDTRCNFITYPLEKNQNTSQKQDEPLNCTWRKIRI